jgi:hypothetical protein
VSSIRPVDKNPTFRGRLHKITITNKQSDIQKIIDDLAKYGYTRDSLIPDSMWDIIKEKIKSLANDYKGN